MECGSKIFGPSLFQFATRQGRKKFHDVARVNFVDASACSSNFGEIDGQQIKWGVEINTTDGFDDVVATNG